MSVAGPRRRGPATAERHNGAYGKRDAATEQSDPER
jgi:hypothetical protein